MKLITIFILLTVIFNQVFAWDSSCNWDAQSLSDASQNLESAISELESAVSEYESACNSSYGYQKDDEYACGNFGYIKSNVDSQRSNVDSQRSNVDSANTSVSYSCGTCNSAYSLIQRLMKENEELKEEIKKLKSNNQPESS